MNITTPTGGGEIINTKDDLLAYINQAGIYIEGQQFDYERYEYHTSEKNWISFDPKRRMWFNGSNYVCEMRAFQDKHHRQNGTGVVARWAEHYAPVKAEV
jgi:hypothetical protein